MSIVNSNRQLGRPKLMQIFSFRYEEYAIFCTMNLSLNGKKIMKKTKYSEKKVQSFKNTVKGVLWFCDKIPDKNHRT